LQIHRSQIIDLNVEYLSWVVDEINDYYKIDLSAEMEISVRDYVEENNEGLCSIAPPQGIFYLLKLKRVVVGMGGLRRIREKIGEIKRMYIRSGYRRKGYGRALLNELIHKAKEFGYHKIFLDTGAFMSSAQRLYLSFGFINKAEYPETEVPMQIRSKWVYMEKTL
jgi:GNAT superfamily N-acetyltransferase